MEKSLAIPIGIVVARTDIPGSWQDHDWRPVGIVLGDIHLRPGSLMRRDRKAAYFYAGDSILNLRATETASYQANIEQVTPRVYAVLKPHTGAQPPTVHLVTAAPDQAESYLEDDAWVMDGAPMPAPLVDIVTEFIAAHPEPPVDDSRAMGLVWPKH